MPLYIAQSGDLDRCNGCLTDGQTLKDSATQLLIKYKSGALVTQFEIDKSILPHLIQSSRSPTPRSASSPIKHYESQCRHCCLSP